MNRLRDVRKRLGLSQAEMASALGVHQTTISRFETGALPIDERTALAMDALLARAAEKLPEQANAA
jgi:transcriptional regulator with XRE-family HTH domain